MSFMPTDTIWSIEVAGDLEKSDGGAKIQSHERWFMILVEFVVHHWCFLGADYFGKSQKDTFVSKIKHVLSNNCVNFVV
ncbi:unnamed protein product [Brassica oleracea]